MHEALRIAFAAVSMFWIGFLASELRLSNNFTYENIGAGIFIVVALVTLALVVTAMYAGIWTLLR